MLFRKETINIFENIILFVIVYACSFPRKFAHKLNFIVCNVTNLWEILVVIYSALYFLSKFNILLFSLNDKISRHTKSCAFKKNTMDEECRVLFTYSQLSDYYIFLLQNLVLHIFTQTMLEWKIQFSLQHNHFLFAHMQEQMGHIHKVYVKALSYKFSTPR